MTIKSINRVDNDTFYCQFFICGFFKILNLLNHFFLERNIGQNTVEHLANHNNIIACFYCYFKVAFKMLNVGH